MPGQTFCLLAERIQLRLHEFSLNLYYVLPVFGYAQAFQKSLRRGDGLPKSRSGPDVRPNERRPANCTPGLLRSTICETTTFIMVWQDVCSEITAPTSQMILRHP